jgi:deoxyribonuclease-4
MADLLGAHMSIAGGLYRALERGREVACSVVQIFLKNQLQCAAKPYTQEDIRQFSAARKATGIRTVFAHSSYLINLAAQAPAEWTRAVNAFHDELERAEALALPFVIIHPGSRWAGSRGGIGRVVGALDEVTSRTRGYRVRVLLENTGGGGATIGRSLRSWPRS